MIFNKNLKELLVLINNINKFKAIYIYTFSDLIFSNKKQQNIHESVTLKYQLLGTLFCMTCG